MRWKEIYEKKKEKKKKSYEENRGITEQFFKADFIFSKPEI